jgi:hypothetical protein
VRVASVVADRGWSRVGYITGVDANNSDPATKPMTSDRWGAVTREQRLLNPHLYLREAVGRARSR